MARSVRYHAEFDSDVLSAAQWYDERQAGLGSDFVVRVERASLALIADPGRRGTVAFGLRYWPVERFPYVVFYDFTDTEIVVLGVMHTSRNPDKWRKRCG